tara:strand:- start:4699 stop:4890 length:192 start_codon:yes stop_codon:yes gene_type:complete
MLAMVIRITRKEKLPDPSPRLITHKIRPNVNKNSPKYLLVFAFEDAHRTTGLPFGSIARFDVL